MNNVKELLETVIQPRRVPVTVNVPATVPALDKDDKPRYEKDGTTPVMKKGEVEMTFSMFGMPDAYFAWLQQLEEHKKVGRCALWTRHYKERHPETQDAFTPDDFFNIMLVAHYIEAPEGQSKASDIDIAMLSKERGPVFFALLNAAFQIVSDKSAEEIADLIKNAQASDPFIGGGLGNSSAEAASTSSPTT